MWCVFLFLLGESSVWWIMWICLMTLQNYSGRLFFANRVSLSCTVSANWRPKGQKIPRRMGVTSPGVGFATPGFGFTSPGFSFTTRWLEKTNRRVGKTTSGFVRAISPTTPMVWICPFLRACIRIWFPEKSIHTFTHRMFSTDFQSFWVWRLAFPSVHTGRKMTVKGWFCKSSHSKTVGNQR